MNEIILNGILHLFAIFAACGRLQRDAALEVVDRYLKQNLGIVADTVYCDLFDEFLSLHTAQSDPAWSWQQARILSETLRSKLPLSDQYLLLVRLMELTRIVDQTEIYHTALQQTADLFAIRRETFNELASLIFHPGEVPPEAVNVRLIPSAGLASAFSVPAVVLLLRDTGTLLLTPLGAGINVDETPVPPRMIRVLTMGSQIADPHGTLLYYGDLLRTFSSAKPAPAPFIFAGRDVNFRFPDSKNGLHDFTFSENSGCLIGVMGGSGVGKSTLLSILNGTLPPDSGTITINGIDLYRQTERLPGVIGYVPQEDLLIEELTVAENLSFSARLCLAHLPAAEIRRRVEATLRDLQQQQIAQQKVGNPLQKAISGGERKRLNIALELIREPAILFVDEPTSGLSSADSENVMNLLKAQSARGKLVIVIIHQPSSNIYKLFDTLWVLDSGGYPIYCGNPLEAIRYFRETTTLAGAGQLFCPQCGQVNPEQILSLIATRKIGADGHFTSERTYPPDFWHQRYRAALTADSVAPAVAEIGPAPPSAVHTPTRSGQIAIFLQRNFFSRLANRPYLAINLLEAPLLALLIAGISRYGGDAGYSFGDNRNLVTFFFMSVITALFLGLTISAEEIVRDRRILQRESFLHLSWFSYLAAKFLYLAALSAVQILLYLTVSSVILEIPALRPQIFAVLFSCALFACALGLNISSAFRTAVAIYILIPLLLIPQLLLSGVVIRLDDLIPRDTGNYYTPLAADLMASRWGLEALVTEEFSANPYQRRFFAAEKAVSQAAYLSEALIPELRAKLDFLSLTTALPDKEERDERYRRVLRAGFREVERKSGLASPFLDDIFSAARLDRPVMAEMKSYLEQAALLVQGEEERAVTLLRRERMALAANPGSGDLRRRQHNKSVEALALNQEELDPVRLSGERLIQLSDPIYQEPDSPWGRAPFMAGEKRLGPLTLSTFTFNLSVLWAMTGLLLLALYSRLLQKIVDLPLLARLKSTFRLH